jgi:hypothetical protein
MQCAELFRIVIPVHAVLMTVACLHAVLMRNFLIESVSQSRIKYLNLILNLDVLDLESGFDHDTPPSHRNAGGRGHPGSEVSAAGARNSERGGHDARMMVMV